MKILLSIIIIVCFACKSTTTIERSNRFIPNNIGKCYTNIATKQKTKGGFSLKVIDNQYSTVKDSIHSMFQFSKNRTFLKNLKNNILIYNKISIFYFYKNYKKIIKF